MPFISVIIPTCDRLSALAACLERLAPGEQALGATMYEVVVSDDSPCQSARAMVKDKFPWARWVEGQQRGPAANRNHGAATSQAEWLVFTDDDCLPTRGWLAAYAAAAKGAGCAALEGRTSANPGFVTVWDEAPANETGGWFWSCNIAVRRDLFIRLGGFDANYRFAAMEDVDFRQALVAHAVPVLFVPAAEVNHPTRRVGPLGKLRRIEKLESHVYFARKWSNAGSGTILAELLLVVTRHWLIGPLRSKQKGGMSLLFLYPAMIAKVVWKFRRWLDASEHALRTSPPTNNLGARQFTARGIFG